MRREIKVKAWVIDKAQDTAARYNMWIDILSREDDYTHATKTDENGYYTVLVEEDLAETEKAIKVRLSTGDIVGSYKGWTLWIPKSQIAA